MARIPLDVKALIEEALHVSAAANEPVSVSVYLDETAPQDVVAHVRNVFASAAVHVRVTLSYLGPSQAPIGASDDLAVIAAGQGTGVGAFAQQTREQGVPAMVVTTQPSLVARIAEQSGFPIPEGDVISPIPATAASAPLVQAVNERMGGEGAAAPAASAEPVAEPIALTEPNARVLNQRMGAWVIEACRDKRLSMALAFPFVRRPLSLEAVNMTSVQNAAFGAAVFIPGASMPVITMNQAKMLLQIAAAYGQPMNGERVKELAALVAGGFAFRTVAREVAGVVPVLGWAVKGGVAYGATLAMGHAAVDYFESGGGVAGLAGVVARARDAAIAAASKGEEPQPVEPEQQKTVQESVADAAQVWGERAGKVAGVASRTAGPLVRSMAQAGLDSFVAGAGSLASALKKH
ncbi:MAG: hypothetical protein Q4D06_00580 [Coriobacteriia bacterium]|nr:hypothetical protein [Coriobacteriia bacterium]